MVDVVLVGWQAFDTVGIELAIADPESTLQPALSVTVVPVPLQLSGTNDVTCICVGQPPEGPTQVHGLHVPSAPRPVPPSTTGEPPPVHVGAAWVDRRSVTGPSQVLPGDGTQLLPLEHPLLLVLLLEPLEVLLPMAPLELPLLMAPLEVLLVALVLLLVV